VETKTLDIIFLKTILSEKVKTRVSSAEFWLRLDLTFENLQYIEFRSLFILQQSATERRLNKVICLDPSFGGGKCPF